MNDDPRTNAETPRRGGVQRRVTNALVTNYIHEISDRHGGPEHRPSGEDLESGETAEASEGG